MEGKKIPCYPDRLSLHGRDDMWDMGLGVWPCSAVLGRTLSEPSPVSSPPGDCHPPGSSVRPRGALGTCPGTIPAADWGNVRAGVRHHNSGYTEGLGGASPSTAKAEGKGAWLLFCQNPESLSFQGRGWRWPEPFQSHSYLRGKPWRQQGCHT